MNVEIPVGFTAAYAESPDAAPVVVISLWLAAGYDAVAAEYN